MRIWVNGDERQLEASVTVGDLVEALGLRPGWVVVEKNRGIVPRERMSEELIRDGDSLEIVRLVGGG